MPRVHKTYSRPDFYLTSHSSESTTNGGCINSGWNATVLRRKEKGEYWGDRTPGWSKLKKRVDDGEFIVLPLNFYARYDQRLTTEGRIRLQWKPFWCSSSNRWTARVADAIGGPWVKYGLRALDVNVDVPYAIRESGIDSQTRMHAAASKLWDGLDVITTLVELKEVLHLLPDLIQSVKRLYAIEKVLYKRGFISTRDAKRIPHELASLYLQYRFGWEQVFRDAESIWESLNAVASPIFRGTSQTSVGFTKDETFWVGPYINGESEQLAQTTAYNVSCRGIVVALSAIRQARKSAFSNPAIAAWELIPYSWIVDYVYDVGNVIGTLSTLALTEGHKSAVGWHVSIHRQTTVVDTKKGSNLDAYSSSGSAVDFLDYRARIPTPISLKPSLELSLTVRQIANLFALVVQSLTK